MRYCPRCGAELREGDSFCNKCGLDLSQVQRPSDVSGGQVPPREPSPIPQGIPAPQRRTVNVAWLAVLLITVILVSASVGGIYILTKDIPDSEDDIKVTYTWKADNKGYSYTLTIPRDDYRAMEKSRIDRTGTVSSDLYIVNNEKGSETVYGVKDYIVVDDNVRKVADDLKGIYDDMYGSLLIKPEFAQFLAWFVQNAIDYQEDSSFGSAEYWKYPLETLRDGKGDCEDGSILLAALLDASGYDGGVYLLPGHAMAAVSADSVEHPYMNERFGYYPIETAYSAHTVTRDIGEVSESYEFAYFHLYTGYVTSYA